MLLIADWPGCLHTPTSTIQVPVPGDTHRGRFYLISFHKKSNAKTVPPFRVVATCIYRSAEALILNFRALYPTEINFIPQVFRVPNPFQKKLLHRLIMPTCIYANTQRQVRWCFGMKVSRVKHFCFTKQEPSLGHPIYISCRVLFR